MPRVTIDTTEALSSAPTAPGPYPMKISTAEGKLSKEHVPMLNIAFEFEDPAKAKECGKVFRNYMLAGKGAGFTREFIKAVTGQDIPVGGNFDFDTDDLIGRPIIAQIGNREYNGQLQNEVERIVPVG